MDTKYMVCLQGNVIETTITCKDSVVREWIRDVVSTAHIYQNIVGINRIHKDDYNYILQLCIGTKCLLYQTLYSDKSKFDSYLTGSFLKDHSFVFAGVETEGKFEEAIVRDSNYVDVQTLAVTRWCWPMNSSYPNYMSLKNCKWKPGLKVLARSVAHLNIERPDRVMSSNWTDRELSVEQIEFACIDAYACFRIGYELLKHGNSMPNIMKSADDGKA